jgi:hypothetical protein
MEGRYERVGGWIRSTCQLFMPDITLEDGEVAFGDGRHRFAWLRDHGVVALPVAVRPSQAMAIEARFGSPCRQGNRLKRMR